jgi:tetratricopeptide (TPR) repeat protein
MSCSRVSLVCVALAFAAPAHAQKTPASASKTQASGDQAQANLPPAEDDNKISPDQLPPDEDKSKAQPEEYKFNPLQSKKDVTVGEFYFRKGDFKAAAGRFREATKWNDGNAEAWLRLGDAEDKMKDAKAAKEAWEKYLQLSPTAKNAAEVRKKLGK